MAEPLLVLDGMSVSYGRIRAVRDCALRVAPGEVVCLLGSNGAGKSSTLNAIAGLATVSGGRIVLDGRDITALTPERRVRAGVALSPEGRRVFAGLTVDENLRLAAWRLSRAERAERLREVTTLFRVLDAKRGARAGSLSGGEQQQLALSRALLADPRVLLLDEPSLGLDPLNTERIFEALAALKRRGMTILLAEQNTTRALALADRAYLLESGRVTLHDAVTALSPDTIEAAYLGLTGPAASPASVVGGD